MLQPCPVHLQCHLFGCKVMDQVVHNYNADKDKQTTAGGRQTGASARAAAAAAAAAAANQEVHHHSPYGECGLGVGPLGLITSGCDFSHQDGSMLGRSVSTRLVNDVAKEMKDSVRPPRIFKVVWVDSWACLKMRCDLQGMGSYIVCHFGDNEADPSLPVLIQVVRAANMDCPSKFWPCSPRIVIKSWRARRCRCCSRTTRRGRSTTTTRCGPNLSQFGTPAAVATR